VKQPADVQAELPIPPAEQPAQAQWDPWRKADRPVAPSATAADDEHAAEPAAQPAPEPAQPAPNTAGESPEETTMPIPIIRD
jgi:hypothetical protein